MTSGNHARSHSGRILIAEDEIENAKILQAYLDDAGYEVTLAHDGLEAWNILEKDSAFEMVISDKNMPNMDGLVLASRISSDRRFVNMPVIIQSGETSQEDITKGIKAGVFYYLGKPYEEETILSIVRNASNDRKLKEFFISRIEGHKLALGTCVKAHFEIRTPDEAQKLAMLLSGAFLKQDMSASGLYELLMNAIEHGNLQIGYDDKGKFLAEDTLDKEIDSRLKNELNRDKNVTVDFLRTEHDIIVTITDQGEGFDWRNFMEIEPGRATMPHGRGIAKANLLCFDKTEYLGKGNQVRIVAEKKVE